MAHPVLQGQNRSGSKQRRRVPRWWAECTDPVKVLQARGQYLPKGSNVVPFGQYIIIMPRKKTSHNQKGTTLEPLGTQTFAHIQTAATHPYSEVLGAQWSHPKRRGKTRSEPLYGPKPEI